MENKAADQPPPRHSPETHRCVEHLRTTCKTLVLQVQLTKDIDAEFKILKSRDVKFRSEPIKADNLKLVVFDDTCENLLQLIQIAEQ